jgi:CRISPR-associated protein Cas2
LNCIVIYDIPSNRARGKVADACMDYGMNRIQFSAFAGDLLRAHQEELILKARRLLGKSEGKVYLYCIGETEWDKRLEVIVEPKPKAVASRAKPVAAGEAPGGEAPGGEAPGGEAPAAEDGQAAPCVVAPPAEEESDE